MLFTHSFEHDPSEALDYARDWRRHLASGETVAESHWTVAMLGVDGSDVANDGSLVVTLDQFGASGATIWVRGGTAGKTYFLTNTISTNQGRTFERSIRLIVLDL